MEILSVNTDNPFENTASLSHDGRFYRLMMDSNFAKYSILDGERLITVHYTDENSLDTWRLIAQNDRETAFRMAIDSSKEDISYFIDNREKMWTRR